MMKIEVKDNKVTITVISVSNLMKRINRTCQHCKYYNNDRYCDKVHNSDGKDFYCADFEEAHDLSEM